MTHGKHVYFYFELDQAKNNMCNTAGTHLTNSHILKSQSYLFCLAVRGTDTREPWEEIKVKTTAIERENQKREKEYFFKSNWETCSQDLYQ